MSKLRRNLIATFVACWLFVFAIVIVVEPNAVAQTHEGLHQAESTLDHEKAAAGIIDPALDLARLPQDTPTSIVGRILDPEERGVPRTAVTLTEADGTKHLTTSDSFGNFRFDEVTGGQKVVLSADADSHPFSDLPVGLYGETIVNWRARIEQDRAEFKKMNGRSSRSRHFLRSK